ncbi:MAG: alpha-ribazole phosphatase [Bacillota bacterium]
MRKIYLIRHGQTDANVEKRYCGWTDINLNSKGIKQAKKIGKKLSNLNIENFFASDLKRVKETAKYINKYHKKDITYLKEIREMNFGDFENLTFKEISKKYPEQREKIVSNNLTYQFPNGESLKELYDRSIKTFKKLLKNKGNILIVSHGGVIGSILTHVLSGNIENYWSVEVKNATLNTLVEKKEFLYLNHLNALGGSFE